MSFKESATSGNVTIEFQCFCGWYMSEPVTFATIKVDKDFCGHGIVVSSSREDESVYYKLFLIASNRYEKDVKEEVVRELFYEVYDRTRTHLTKLYEANKLYDYKYNVWR